MASEKRGRLRTLVVEDEEKIAAGICSRIESLDDEFMIVGTAANGEEALEKIEKLHPQVVFTDIAMPVMDGMELARQIKRLSPHVIVVIISGYSDFSYAQQAIRYGVFNYLLKPLQDDALLESLFDIKKSLSYFSVGNQRHMIYSPNFELAFGDKEKFLLIHICIGNIIYNMQDEEVIEFYSGHVEPVNWRKIMEELFDESIEWFVSDDHAPNQKMAAVKIKDHSAEGVVEYLKKLPVLVREYTELPVNVCTMQNPIFQAELWDYSKRLRNIMKQRLVIGKNGFFYLENNEQYSNDMLEIVKMKLNTYIKNYYISTDLDHFLNEMQTVFRYMESNHASQENIEKICLYVMKLLEISKKKEKGEDLSIIQERMIRNISMTVSEKRLFSNLLQEFGKLNRYMEAVYEKDVEVRLLDYVNEHYLDIESVEQLAEEFGYNYAYLSRMFKKKAGESISRYITLKKMNLARKFLKEHPDMNVTDVAEMCGYHDYRYFSRVFKAETGKAPSEYRETLF